MSSLQSSPSAALPNLVLSIDGCGSKLVSLLHLSICMLYYALGVGLTQRLMIGWLLQGESEVKDGVF
jgi:hypothetical protein